MSTRIAVIGAGLIGATHIDAVQKASGVALAAIIDPSDHAGLVAARAQVAHFRSLEAALDAGALDAAIVATPNETHVPLGLHLIEAGIPALIEKPVADTVADGVALAQRAQARGVPILVGHHRRYNPMIRAVRAAIESGAFGQLVSAHISATMAKPAAYFETPFRIAPETGGPLTLNLIHEIDMLRFFFGEVAQVIGDTSNAQRGHAVEDTAAAILRFEGGGMATLNVTDAGCGPWSYDLGAGESRGLPRHDGIYAHIYAGTKAGISLPDGRVWRHPGSPDWTQKMAAAPLEFTPADPFTAQAAHLGAVARGEAEPAVSCADGVANVAVIAAIKESARQGAPVSL
ncbi:MAG: Gfo/Idh/MocA family oxidoreductase [Pseudomonadota bacterium]